MLKEVSSFTTVPIPADITQNRCEEIFGLAHMSRSHVNHCPSIHRPAPRAEVHLSNKQSGKDRACKVVEIGRTTLHICTLSSVDHNKSIVSSILSSVYPETLQTSTWPKRTG
jgi:hypothetical protein